MKNEKFFNPDSDIKTLRLLQRSYDVSLNYNALSASLYAGSSNTYAVTIQASGLSGSVSSYDANGTPSNISLTGLFQQIASFFFGRSDNLVPQSSNSNLTTNVCKVIFVNRPTLDEGIKPGSVTANISTGGTAHTTRIGIIDIPVTSSTDDLKLGRTGKLVISSSTSNQVGSIWYNWGIMVFHGGDGSATGNMFISTTGVNTGLFWGDPMSGSASSLSARVNVNSMYFKTQKYIVRNSYFCRLYNNEFNYTSNVTSKQSNGELLETIQEVPSAYVTTIGLFNNNDECLAVAKISPPIRKHSGNEHIFAVTLNF